MPPRILTVAETGSTNADLLEVARAGGAEDGMWLRAERQTAGRGRQGRGWVSPTGNLSASTLTRLRPGDPPAATLSLVAGVALSEAVRALQPAAGVTLKWPNDLMRGDAKVAGILLERTGDWVVTGFGVNLASAPDVGGRAVSRLDLLCPATLLTTLAEHLAIWRNRWRRAGLEAIVAAWMEHAHPVGTRLSVSLPDSGASEGAFDGLDASGALRLRLADGSARVIHAGDVFLV